MNIWSLHPEGILQTERLNKSEANVKGPGEERTQKEQLGPVNSRRNEGLLVTTKSAFESTGCKFLRGFVTDSEDE